MGLFGSLREWVGGDADDEQGLISSARRGDARAFDALMARHDRALQAFLARRVGAHSSEDVVQETWLACWQAMSRFNGRSSFKAWMFGIAHHKAMDHFRAQGRHALPSEIEGELLMGRQQSIEELYAAADLKETVQKALSELTSVQREVVELYYYDELTLAEIANILRRNLNTVKYQFYRAHALVAESIGEHVLTPLDAAVPQADSFGARRLP